MRTLFGLVAGFAASLTMLSFDGVEAQQQVPAMPAAADADALSVLTYNVEGLPAPFAFGRAKAAGEIAARLKALREVGQQPHVVVLQEAFGAAQRAIGAKAGYRYIVFGPDRDLKNDEMETAEDRAFAKGARLLKGETLGKWSGSGLAILSDYPIVSVKRAAFPAYACAGYDCIANKGVMLATIAVPGSAAPVAVIATHMNSKDASGVAKARWNGAFERQVQTIGAFLRANLAADTPYIFAGDTNIGKSPIRRAALEAMFAALPRTGGAYPVRTALGTCLETGSACALSAPDEARKSFARNKDWQVYAAGAATALSPTAIGVPFGHDATGRMLSDHIGYTAFYRLAAATAPATPSGAVVALR